MKKRSFLRRAQVVAVGLGLGAGEVAAAQEPGFTVVAVPDTQYYTCRPTLLDPLCAGDRDTLQEQLEWVAEEQEDRDIRFVAGLGDCVEHAELAAEYAVASRAYRRLEEEVSAEHPDGVPFSTAVGNHDQVPVGDPGRISGGDPEDRDQGSTTSGFNATFGVERFCPRGACRSYYGGHFGTNNDNRYDLFEAGAYRFLVVSVEYMPRDDALRRAVLDWADDVLTLFPDRRAILVTHHALDTGEDADFSDQGQALFDALSHHPGLFLILGGHIPGEGRRTDRVDGRSIHTLLADYQGRSRGGDGWLRLLEFEPEDDRIRVRTYSPTQRRHETDDSSDFRLEVDLDGGYPEPVSSFRQGEGGYAAAVDLGLGGPAAVDASPLVGWDDDPGQVALLRFAGLSAAEGGPIPEEATVRSATLLYTLEDGGADADLHEVWTPWGPDLEEATFGPTPGAQPGEDYDPSPVGRAPGAGGRRGRAHAVDVTASVARWVRLPESNQGWILVPSGPGGASLRSSEAPTPHDRPRLVVSWALEPCATDADCDDLRPCTTDTCSAGACGHAPLAECCALDLDCDDRDPCTLESCDPVDHLCVSDPLPVCPDPETFPIGWR